MRLRRRWLILGALLLSAVALQSCSTFQVRRAQKRRAYLGDRLFVETAGAGDRTIVFIPGLMGSTAYWQHATAAAPPSGRRHLFVDLLGFGRSPWPDGEYTMQEHVAALRRTLVAQNATHDVTIVAHSLGTLIAVAYAAEHPGEVEQLVLFGAPLYRDRKDAKRRVGTMSPLAALLVKSRTSAKVVCAFHNAMMPLAAKIAPKLRPDLPADVAHDGALHFWPSLDGSVRHVILDMTHTERLGRVGDRTTIVHGFRDTVSDLAFIEDVAKRTGARFIRTTDTHQTYWQTIDPKLLE